MTEALIFGIVFAIFALIIIATLMILYLGGKTDDDTFAFIYVLLFIFIFLSGAFFAGHVNKVNEQESLDRQEIIQEPDVIE